MDSSGSIEGAAVGPQMETTKGTEDRLKPHMRRAPGDQACASTGNSRTPFSTVAAACPLAAGSLTRAVLDQAPSSGLTCAAQHDYVTQVPISLLNTVRLWTASCQCINSPEVLDRNLRPVCREHPWWRPAYLRILKQRALQALLLRLGFLSAPGARPVSLDVGRPDNATWQVLVIRQLIILF